MFGIDIIEYKLVSKLGGAGEKVGNRRLIFKQYLINIKYFINVEKEIQCNLNKYLSMKKLFLRKQ